MNTLTPYITSLKIVANAAPGSLKRHIFLVVVGSFTPAVSAYVLKMLIDTLAHQSELTSSRIYALAILLGSIYLVNALIKAWDEFLLKVLSEKTSHHVNNLILQKSIELDQAFYEQSEYHNTLHRAQYDSSTRPVRILGSLTSATQSLLSLLWLGVLLFSLHWLMGLLLLLTTFPSLLVNFRHSRWNYDHFKQITNLERLSWYYRSLITLEFYAKEIRTYGLGSLFKKRFKKIELEIYSGKISLEKDKLKYSILAKTLESIALIGVYFLVALRTFAGLLTLGDLVMYLQVFQRSQQFLNTLLRELATLFENRLFVQHLFDLMNLKPQITDPIDPISFEVPIHSGIRISNLTFRYPGNSNPSLTNINLNISPGEKIGFAGTNGAGKTTLAKLLARLYDPQEGSIVINGLDIRQYRVSDLRRQINLLSQNFIRFNFDVAQNIWLGDISRDLEEKEISSYGKMTGADQFIRGLPQKYNTQLGHEFRGGVELSTGQWQKIALSRALFHNPAIIILDEPTSNIDPLDERSFFEQIEDHTTDQIVIVISHNLSVLRSLDRIVVFDEGRIKEVGTHDELYTARGLYYKMAIFSEPQNHDINPN